MILTKKVWNAENDRKQNHRKNICQHTGQKIQFCFSYFCMILRWSGDCKVPLQGQNDGYIAFWGRFFIWKFDL